MIIRHNFCKHRAYTLINSEKQILQSTKYFYLNSTGSFNNPLKSRDVLCKE